MIVERLEAPETMPRWPGKPVLKASSRLSAGDIKELLRVLLRRKRTILTTMLAFILAALAFVVLFPPRYTATTVLLVDPREQRVLASEKVVPGIGQDTAAIESQVEILTSNAMAKRMVEQFDLANSREFKPGGMSDRVTSWLTGAAPAEPLDKVIDKFQNAQSVRRRGLTYVIEVNFRSRDPKLAADVANAVADAYVSDQLSDKVGATSGAADWLSGRIEDLRKAATEAERKVADFKSANRIIDTDALGSGQTLNQKQIEELNNALQAAHTRSAEIAARAEIAKRARRNPKDIESLGDAMESKVLASLRVIYANALRREAETAAQVIGRHPALIAARTQRESVERQIAAELDIVVQKIDNDLAAAKSYEGTLERRLAGLADKNNQLARLRVELNDLERQAEANRSLYTQLLARQKDTAEQKDVQKPDSRIVSRAMPPVKPNMPPLLVLALSSVAGLGLGIGMALLAERADKSYRDRASLEADTGIACLALCPKVSRDEVARTLTGADTSLRRAVSEILKGLASTSSTETGVVLVVTSTHEGEGKTTIASVLSMLFAEAGERTLLVTDTPPERATLLTPTLLTLPQEQRDRALTVRATESGGAKAIPYFAISTDADPDQGAGGGAFLTRRVAQYLAARPHDFDIVIVDGPTLTGGPSRHVLIDTADLLLLLVEQARTTRPDIIALEDSLGVNQQKVIATALTKAVPGQG